MSSPEKKLNLNVDGIITILGALPTFVALINRIALVIEKNNVSGFMSEMELGVDKLEKANNSKEKLDAVASIVGTINKLR